MCNVARAENPHLTVHDSRGQIFRHDTTVVLLRLVSQWPCPLSARLRKLFAAALPELRKTVFQLLQPESEGRNPVATYVMSLGGSTPYYW
jgi:hypothetical protein